MITLELVNFQYLMNKKISSEIYDSLEKPRKKQQMYLWFREQSDWSSLTASVILVLISIILLLINFFDSIFVV